MSAQYLIRMDDACHTMDRHKWGLIEKILDECGVKPIVAVVPDIQDPELMVDPPDSAFWGKVRAWQQKGWTVALHGHTHLMHPTESKLVLPYYKRSEFAGLAYEQQAEKIKKSWQIFKAQSVDPKVWIAPAHCFDLLTLKAIHNETEIRVVSDGIASDVYYENEFFWIPQQLWELTDKQSGLWTVCLHPNMMTDEAIVNLGDLIRSRFKDRIIAFQDVALKKQKKSLRGQLYHQYFWGRRAASAWVRSVFNR